MTRGWGGGYTGKNNVKKIQKSNSMKKSKSKKSKKSIIQTRKMIKTTRKTLARGDFGRIHIMKKVKIKGKRGCIIQTHEMILARGDFLEGFEGCNDLSEKREHKVKM